MRILAHADGYRYSQFCHHYRGWAKELHPIVRQKHRAGEKLFVNYAGQTMPVIGPGTGEVRQIQIFVAVLGASNYSYVEVQESQSLPNWIGAHVRPMPGPGPSATAGAAASSTRSTPAPRPGITL